MGFTCAGRVCQGSLGGMDDDEMDEQPQRFLRPETDLSEGNAFVDGTEQAPVRERQWQALDGTMIDERGLPIILP